MIQPTLIEYSFNPQPAAVLLDASSIKAQTILLLDTFFQIVVHCGSDIVQWRKDGWHEQADHQNFRDLLAAPSQAAKALMKV